MGVPTVANAKSALDKMKHEPCVVTLDPDGTPLHLFSRGGVAFSAEPGMAESDIDLVGVYDLVTTGSGDNRLTFEVAEDSVDLLDVLFAEGTDGVAARYFGRLAGYSMRQVAIKVEVVPWSERTTREVMLTLWLCVKAGAVAITRGPDAPGAWSIELRALPDLDQADGSVIGWIKAPARA